MSKAVMTVREIKSPIRGRSRGFRILLAVMNNDATDPTSGEKVPSFAKKYLIAQSGDYSTRPDSNAVARFLAPLTAWHKVDQVIG